MGAGIEARDRFSGCTALHSAAWAGHASVISALLQAGASASALDSGNLTSRDYCCRRANELINEAECHGYSGAEGKGSAATRFSIATHARTCRAAAQRFSECAQAFDANAALQDARLLRQEQLLAWSRCWIVCSDDCASHQGNADTLSAHGAKLELAWDLVQSVGQLCGGGDVRLPTRQTVNRHRLQQAAATTTTSPRQPKQAESNFVDVATVGVKRARR
jgi:hypothetical protein